MQLDERQIVRYTHHLALKDIGGRGQRTIADAKVLVVGLGGLGSPAALYLAAAGVGTLGLVDDDRVDISNLQRQVLHHTGDIDRPKIVSAREKLAALNPDCTLIAHEVRLEQDNADALVDDYDFVIDATDNFTSKFLINDTCVRIGKPFSHAGVVGFRGQAFTFVPGSLCVRCIFREAPPRGCITDCRGEGVLGATAGVLGSIQATEAIKYILGRDDLLTDRLLTADLTSMIFRTVPLKRDPSCPSCGSV